MPSCWPRTWPCKSTMSPRVFCTRFALGLFAERKNHTRELVLPQREQKITLILPRITSALQQVPPVRALERGCPSRSNVMSELMGKVMRRPAGRKRCGWDSRAPDVFHARKMAGGDEIRAELVCAVNEPAELQVLVAHHARIRRATGLVFVGEVLDDVLLEFSRLVNEVIRD